MNMAAFQDAAREYAAAGIVPLPIAPDGKRPLVRGAGKFGRRAALFIVPKFPDANLGFWCGQHNGVTVADIDSASDAELQYALDTFGDSPVIVRTASGKHHAYYRHGGERRRIRPIKGRAIDILGEGLCVAPPSVRPSGGRYEFVRGGLADLANLPTMRRAALDQLEPAAFKATAPRRHRDGEVVGIGRRNESLFRLVLALAQGAETLAALLADARRANAELARPPLPDAEVQHIARNAWRYKMEDRLMVPGAGSAILLPSALIARLQDAGEADAALLLLTALRAHGRTGKPFALSPLAMERARLIGSWDKRRYRNARKRACDLGELVQVAVGGKGKHDPALYRFARM